MPYQRCLLIRESSDISWDGIAAVDAQDCFRQILTACGIQNDLARAALGLPPEDVLVVTTEHFFTNVLNNANGGCPIMPAGPQSFPLAFGDFENILNGIQDLSNQYSHCAFILNGIISCDHLEPLAGNLINQIRSWGNTDYDTAYPFWRDIADRVDRGRVRTLADNILANPQVPIPPLTFHDIQWIANLSLSIKNGIVSPQSVTKSIASGAYGELVGGWQTTETAYGAVPDGGYGSVSYLPFLDIPNITIPNFNIPQSRPIFGGAIATTNLRAYANGAHENILRLPAPINESFAINICADASMIWNIKNLENTPHIDAPVIIQGDSKTPRNLFASLFHGVHDRADPTIIHHRTIFSSASEFPETITVNTRRIEGETLAQQQTTLLNYFSDHGLLFADTWPHNRVDVAVAPNQNRICGAYYRVPLGQERDDDRVFIRQHYIHSGSLALAAGGNLDFVAGDEMVNEYWFVVTMFHI